MEENEKITEKPKEASTEKPPEMPSKVVPFSAVKPEANPRAKDLPASTVIELRDNLDVGVKPSEKPTEKSAEKPAEEPGIKTAVKPSVKPIIKVEKLKVIYNKGKSNEVRALDGVDAVFYPQEYVVIFGPSGCGKSTLLYSISGLQAPTEGRIEIGGKKISHMNKYELVTLHQKVTGMIFQAFYLIPSLNVIDNICLPKIFVGEGIKKRREQGIKLLHRFSIVEQANKFPSQLSGGQKQRVSIARALINDPEIILADEPVGNLDSESAENVMQILQELNQVDKKTIILVTHNPDHLHYADRVIHMKDGLILKEDVNKEKKPEYVNVRKEDVFSKDISSDLRMLMRAFKNLSIKQVGALLIPFKADQIMSHIISEFTEEQLSTATGYLRELLFRNIDIESFQKGLDMSYEKGGANWNRKRAESFAWRVQGILGQVEMLNREKDTTKASTSFCDYLENLFKLNLDRGMKVRFEYLIKSRIENKIDHVELQKKLDARTITGGMGLRKGKAEKVSREVEIIMLSKYSS